MSKRKWLGIGVTVAFSISAAVYAYTSATATANIQVSSASTLPNGLVANVIPYTGPQTTVTVTDRPSQSAGAELYEIDLGNSSLSNQIDINLLWTNPTDTAGVLHKGWLEVGVYYPSSSGSYTLPDANHTKVALDSSTLSYVNEQNADVFMRPSIGGQSTLYILASITNSQYKIPSGQQGQAYSLKFFANVRKQ